MARRAAVEWVNSEDLADLVKCFGGEIPAGSFETRVTWLVQFSARWDFRQGSERFTSDGPEMGATAEEVVLRAASGLGLRGEHDTRMNECDLLVVLGGMAHSCFRRPQYAARLLHRWQGCLPQVVGVAGHRVLSGPEVAIAADIYGVENVETEGGLLSIGLERALNDVGLDSSATVSIAPAEGALRPTSYLSLKYAVDSLDMSPGMNVAIVTTDIYVPYHFFTSLQVLQRTLVACVETLGVGVEFPASNYLQEIRSALQAISRLFLLEPLR